jgi:predicted nucleic acid-binding protein
VPTATAAKVVDASAIAALLLEEPEQARIADILRNADLYAPHLLAYEIANICATKMRHNPEAKSGFAAALTMLFRLGIHFHEVDYGAVLVLADETGLTAYDASYLWLARRLDAELITLDRQLAVAASGIE